MVLHRICDASAELMDLTKAASWQRMTPEEREKALARALELEGTIRDLAALHSVAMRKVLRQRHHLPPAQPLHMHELPPAEQFVEMVEEIDIPSADTCMKQEAVDETHCMPENVAYYYQFARIVHDQAMFLAAGADDRHAHNRERARHAHEIWPSMQGLA